MKNSLRIACALLLALALPLQAIAKEPAVLLISIDGLHPDYVLDADKYGLDLPVLRGFVDNGAHAESVLNVSPTVTYPNHTALVTGVAPRTHGIYTNTVFDPMGVEKGAWNWYGSQIQVPTLWDAAKARGLVTASVLWPVSVAHPAIDYNMPEYWRTKTQPSDDNLLRAVSTPRGFLESVDGVDALFNAAANEDGAVFDEKLSRIAQAMIERGRPNLLTIHLASLDGAQHADGPLPINRKAQAMLEEIDAMVGRIVAAERKAYPDATIAVASDHGFLTVTALVNLNAALSKAGLIRLTGDDVPKVESWKAYAWNSGGSASVVLQDPGDEATAAVVDSLLATLAADPANGIAKVLRGDEAIAAGALPQASFLVDCRSGFALGEALAGDVVKKTKKTTGTHGYLNTHPEMHASFFVIGPGIKPGTNLGRIDIRSIAPTLAQELGVALPLAESPALPLRGE